MECRRCGTELTKKGDNPDTKKAVERLGVTFGGTYICRRCYPE